MPALKSATGLRCRRENDEEELPQSEQRLYRQLFGKLLWIDRVALRCAMGKASSSRGRASETDTDEIKATQRYLRVTPGVMTVGSLQNSLDAAKRAVEGSVLALSDSDSASDSGKHSVSLTSIMDPWKAHMVHRHCNEQQTVSGGEAELVAPLSGSCEGMGLRQSWHWFFLRFGCRDTTDPNPLPSQTQLRPSASAWSSVMVRRARRDTST